MQLDRLTVDIICRALLAIVARLREVYGLPEYHGVTIVIAGEVEDGK